MLNLFVIDKTLQESYNELEFDKNIVDFLSNIDNIIRNIESNNNVHCLIFEIFDFAEEKLLNNDNINILNINSSCIIKSNNCLTKAKNKKDIIIQAKKTKTKSTRRDSLDFKYIDARICILRNNKDKEEVLNNSKNKNKVAIFTFIFTTTTTIKAYNKQVQKQ